ncbi:MAG: glutamyl-tRNA reductase [Actinomycetota bacterium]|nr:glutamyl-tRNA reductase [Actinomycetota bacterium]
MSELVIGLSHRTAPLSLLERGLQGQDGQDGQDCSNGLSGLAERLCRSESVREAAVLATCNRLEIYTDVRRFHGAVTDIGTELAHATGLPLRELTGHLYVHYGQAAVAHLFRVVCGLDSMALGEQQILGQVRQMLCTATAEGTVGRVLNHLVQRSLHVGKRAHTETALDDAGRCLVGAGLDLAREHLGDLADRRTLVIGAGTMSGLTVASLSRAGAGEIAITSRTFDRARRLAGTVHGRAIRAEHLPEALAGADLVISCTGTQGYRLDLPTMREAGRDRRDSPRVVIDLALPRDVDPQVATLDGITLVDLERLGQFLAGTPITVELDQVHALVEEEVRTYLADRRAQAVVPTVVALRERARSVVEAELERLQTRLPDADPHVLAELERSVHRIVEKLLHTPTIRVKQMACEPGGAQYAQVLNRLFDLEPDRMAAVCTGREPLPTAAVHQSPTFGEGTP